MIFASLSVLMHLFFSRLPYDQTPFNSEGHENERENENENENENEKKHTFRQNSLISDKANFDSSLI